MRRNEPGRRPLLASEGANTRTDCASGSGIPAVDTANWNLRRTTIANDSTYVRAVAVGIYTHSGLYRPVVRVVNKAAEILKSVAGF